jgi:hypothetical protein
MNPELEQLLAKLKRDALAAEGVMTDAQARLADIREKLRGVEMTVALLNGETPSLPLNGSSRFKGKELGAAVLDCVNTFGGEGISRPQLTKLLKEHGFKYRGLEKHLYSSVSITAKRLAKKGDIDTIKKHGELRFKPKITMDDPLFN